MGGVVGSIGKVNVGFGKIMLERFPTFFLLWNTFDPKLTHIVNCKSSKILAVARIR
jgi:hypothetical protein